MENLNNSGICSIEVDGENIPIRFGMPANRIIFQKFAEHPEWITGSVVDERAIVWILYAGYINACMLKDQEPAKPFEFFFELTENMAVDDPDRLQHVANVYSNSRFTIKSIENLNDTTAEAIKKKMSESNGSE